MRTYPQVFFVFFASHLLSSPFFFSVPPSRNSDPGPVTYQAFAPRSPLRFVPCIFIARRFQLFLRRRLELCLPTLGALRLIIMRIRFRASDFGLVAKINIIHAKSKQASCAEMVLGSFVFCSCGSAVTFLDSENSSQRRLLLCSAPRGVHFARPWTQASNPCLLYTSDAADE